MGVPRDHAAHPSRMPARVPIPFIHRRHLHLQPRLKLHHPSHQRRRKNRRPQRPLHRRFPETRDDDRHARGRIRLLQNSRRRPPGIARTGSLYAIWQVFLRPPRQAILRIHQITGGIRRGYLQRALAVWPTRTASTFSIFAAAFRRDNNWFQSDRAQCRLAD